MRTKLYRTYVIFSTVALENNKEHRDKSIFYLPLYHSILTGLQWF